ncbi:MAG: phosphatase PAP2 family protein [Hydrogenobaculum sp.]
MKKYIKYIIMAATLIFSTVKITYAIDDSWYKAYDTTKKDIYSYPSFLWNKKAYTIGALAVIGSSLLIDKSVKNFFIHNKNKTANDIANVVEPFGNYMVMIPLVSGMSFYGYFTDHKKLKDASLTSLESGLFAGVMAFGLKTIVGRERPNYTNSNVHFKPFKIEEKYSSFPSGSATIAWATITPYAVYYNKPILYAIPVMVDVERLYKNKHWTSDVLAGSFLGFSVGFLLSQNHLKLFGKDISIQTDGRSVVLSTEF